MQAVEERICDQPVLKLLRAMLRAGVMEDGQVRRPVTGTPQGGVATPPTQWITSALMSRWATGGWNGRGVSRADSDMSGSIFMAWLSMAALAAASMLSGSTRPRSWLRGACRPLRRPGCWPAGSGARRGRPAGMRIRRRHRDGSRCRRQPWCSRSRCRPGSRTLSGSMPGCRGGRSPPWSRKRWRSFSPGAAETIPAGERPGGRGGVRLRPSRGHGIVGGLRHIGAAAAGPHRAAWPGRTAAA